MSTEDDFLPDFFKPHPRPPQRGSRVTRFPPTQQQALKEPTNAAEAAVEAAPGASEQEPVVDNLDEADLTAEERIELRANRVFPTLGLDANCYCNRCLSFVPTDLTTVVLTPPVEDLTGAISRQVQTICNICWEKMNKAVQKKEYAPLQDEWDI